MLVNILLLAILIGVNVLDLEKFTLWRQALPLILQFISVHRVIQSFEIGLDPTVNFAEALYLLAKHTKVLSFIEELAFEDEELLSFPLDLISQTIPEVHSTAKMLNAAHSF